MRAEPLGLVRMDHESTTIHSTTKNDWFKSYLCGPVEKSNSDLLRMHSLLENTLSIDKAFGRKCN